MTPGSVVTTEHRTRGERFFDAAQQQLYAPLPAVDVAWLRIVVFGYWLYKLLSRDFPLLALAPPEYFTIYPHGVFPPEIGYFILGRRWIVDICTMHWIHWFLPHPGETLMTGIYYAAMVGCLTLIVFGRGRRNVFAIATFLLLNYLWGFLWRSTQDVDGIFLPLQLAFIHMFATHDEALVLGRRVPCAERSREAGWFLSMALLCFIGYYFLSGVNKVSDITVAGWLQFDLATAIESTHDRIDLGYHRDSPAFFRWLVPLGPLLILPVPLVYLSHLLIPLIFVHRQAISSYMGFYLVFHLLSWSVGILFLGVLLMWFGLVPVHRLGQPVALTWSRDDPYSRWLVRILRRLDAGGRLSYFPGPQTIAQGRGSTQRHEGFRAWRRALWALPAAWIILPIVYLPGMSTTAWALEFLKPRARVVESAREASDGR